MAANPIRRRARPPGCSCRSNFYVAKTQFSSLVRREAHGEETVVAKVGKPVARLVALPMQAKSELLREWGQNPLGITFIADDFYDELPPEMFVNSENDDLLFSKKDL
jgi:antitoxin (DNA-binding transcriptional repressor) of toxin-antitoxin stability system